MAGISICPASSTITTSKDGRPDSSGWCRDRQGQPTMGVAAASASSCEVQLWGHPGPGNRQRRCFSGQERLPGVQSRPSHGSCPSCSGTPRNTLGLSSSPGNTAVSPCCLRIRHCKQHPQPHLAVLSSVKAEAVLPDTTAAFQVNISQLPIHLSCLTLTEPAASSAQDRLQLRCLGTGLPVGMRPAPTLYCQACTGWCPGARCWPGPTAGTRCAPAWCSLSRMLSSALLV